MSAAVVEPRRAAPRVPSELLDLAQWCLWGFDNGAPALIDGEPRKRPMALQGYWGSSIDPATWGEYGDAVDAWQRVANAEGIGFVFTESDPYTGVDLDDCLDDAGRLKEWAVPILQRFVGTYAEISPSGSGIKLWTRGNVAASSVFKYGDGQIEVYSHARFFCVTGEPWPGSLLEIADCQESLDWLIGLNPAGAKKAPFVLPAKINHPNQHFTLRSLAGKLRRAGFEEAELAEALIIASKRCEEIPPESHMVTMAESFCRLYPAGPNAKLPATPAEKAAEFARQVDQTVEWADGDRRAAFDENIGIVPSLANALLKIHHFAQAPGKELYIYRDGVYRRGAEELIAGTVRDTLQDWGKLKSWSSELGKEVAEYIRVSHTPWLWEDPEINPEMLDLLVLQNGVLNLDTKQFGPHSPEYLTPIQIPVDWDADATCPAWERFLSQTLPDDCKKLVWQIVAWLITPDVSQQKAALFVGAGGNGKSVLIDALIRLIGRDNIANKTLHQLEDDRFATADLVGKLANICADLPSQHLKSSSMFKAIVGGDRIDAQRKHKPAFTFRPYSRLLFSANAFPKSQDATDGFYRRWLILPFNKSFEGSAERRSKRELDAELQAPAELSGVLRQALHHLIGLRKRGFSESSTAAEALDEFREVTDPLTGWLNRRTERGPGAISCKDVLFAFNEEVSKPNGLAYMTSNQLTKLLASRGIEKKRSEDWEYRGILWRVSNAE